MSEGTLIWLSTAKLLVVAAFAVLYILGGRKYKVLRRYVGGLLIAGATIGFSIYQESFRSLSIVALVAAPVALAFGYGGDTFWEKLRRRFVYGCAVGSIGVWFAIPDRVDLWLFQLALAVVASVFLGIRNPVPAVEEEALIATLSVCMVPFLVGGP